ncbi:hypothetical protein [Candidatus Ferrigenium straubiae]|jgi:hypothetical protein|uniref:hypothetical protein n=1 Tax=Candidatus Ferrigenium straubiae TaxID=2919506 RepID=UPI003F4AE467
MDTFKTTNGASIQFASSLEQLKIEHILQRDRDVWTVAPEWPYLAINFTRLQEKVASLTYFPVFSSGQLWQNLRAEDVASRLLGLLGGGGTNAGFGNNSRAFVIGKANSKAHGLMNFNTPLIIGSTPWCAEGTHFIYINGADVYQHQFGELITVQGQSRTSSPHFDLTKLSDLRDRYNNEYLNAPKASLPDLEALSALMDETFEQNVLSLSAAEVFHARISVDMESVDYDAPILTKYDRPTHNSGGQPKIEVSFALLHYEKALVEFNAMKAHRAAGRKDEAFAHGIYCAVAAAACIEAIANKLVYLQTAAHPSHNDKRTPLSKINDAASALASRKGAAYAPLVAGQIAYDSLDELRALRNGFMHAKEHETDIDQHTQASEVMTKVDNLSCHNYLKQLRLAVDHIYSQLPDLAPPIVTKSNVIWMGNSEVP